jgi:hypothetical protein
VLLVADGFVALADPTICQVVGEAAGGEIGGV